MLLWTTAKDPKCQEEAYTITCYDDMPFLLEKNVYKQHCTFFEIFIYIYNIYLFLYLFISSFIHLNLHVYRIIYYVILFYGVYMIVMILNHHQVGGNS